MSTQRRYTIGELARLSGLPVKTIRHYSDVGVLPPAERTEAGYRLYGEAERAKLELVRTLRALEVDLPSIRRVLERRTALQEVLELHARAVEAQLAVLRQQQTVLRAAVANGASPGYVQRAHAVARLTADERAQLVAGFLDRVLGELEDVPAAETFRTRMRQASLVDLPPEPRPEQLDAWLELVDIVTDEDFQRRLREGSRRFWGALRPDADLDAYHQALNQTLSAAAEARAAGHAPTSPVAQELAARAAGATAELVGQRATAAFRAQLAKDWKTAGDPRAERYWELVAVIKDWGPWPPPAHDLPPAVHDPSVYAWLREALEASVAEEPPSGDDRSGGSRSGRGNAGEEKRGRRDHTADL